uniref:Pentatricopeptide repeat-containing protein n=1 Tax=Kalanchoe fedtschenkoi TaxID=63787 RepID=A0A7N0TEM1_KALFE
MGCDQFVLASLVNLYAKYGDMSTCRYIFNQISDPDLVTWNTVLTAYAGTPLAAGCGDWDVGFSMDALYTFHEMQRGQIRPDEKTMVAVISACANVGALRQGAWAHSYMLKNDLEMNVHVGTSLIDMYVKCGCLDAAYQMFVKMPKRDTLCFNAMIGGFAVHGYGQRALEVFERMNVEGLVPDDVTIVVVLCGCSHAGLVEEGYKIFDSMDGAYGIEPKVEHYACLVDLLGRAGRLSEAEQCVHTMPMKPNAVVWRSLLGAARVHGSLEIGEVALENLIQLEPETTGNYVLLSNIYANMDRFDDVKRVRKLMKDNAVDKMPGSCFVEMDGAIYEFLMGDPTCPWL